jgi:hypothetical protein
MWLKRKGQREKIVPSFRFGVGRDVLLLSLLEKVNSTWAEISPNRKLLLSGTGRFVALFIGEGEQYMG